MADDATDLHGWDWAPWVTIIVALVMGAAFARDWYSIGVTGALIGACYCWAVANDLKMRWRRSSDYRAKKIQDLQRQP